MAHRTVVSVAGGLGNQLFTFAAGAVLAQQARSDVLIDVTRVAHAGSTADTIAAFDLGCEVVDLFHGSLLASRAPALLIRTAWKLGLWKATLQPLLGLYMSNVRGFDPGILELSKPMKLRGLFQDYRYAEAIWPHAASRQFPLLNPSSWFLEESQRAQHEGPIMVHIRRGDFRMHTSFGLLSPGYYREVIAEERALNPDRPVWVFSDEVEAAATLAIPGTRYLRSPSGAAEEMKLMSHGSALVIANSTFSWWSAWMAGERARVYVPYPWFVRETWATGFHVPGWHQRPAKWL